MLQFGHGSTSRLGRTIPRRDYLRIMKVEGYRLDWNKVPG